MRFIIVTHVLHKKQGNKWFAYAPYVREMNLWSKQVQELWIVAPVSETSPGAIDLAYEHPDITFYSVPALQFTSASALFKSAIALPGVIRKIAAAMRQSDHIHLRCPGNMGLLGSFVQIFFPSKPKTAKYAGNWDWNSRQPRSYRLQQRLLRNTFLTRNMRALVYGSWPDQTANMVPFFTASYRKDVLTDTPLRIPTADQAIRLLYAGALKAGKNPRLALETAFRLKNNGYEVWMDFFGDGPEREMLEKTIAENNAATQIKIWGNVDAETLKKAYQQAHFLIFPSKSEGWPKVVAEAMAWGCVPVASRVSCVPDMLENGGRGLLVSENAQVIADAVDRLIRRPGLYAEMAGAAMHWSRQYTLEYFNEEIQKLLIQDAGLASH